MRKRKYNKAYQDKYRLEHKNDAKKYQEKYRKEKLDKEKTKNYQKEYGKKYREKNEKKEKKRRKKFYKLNKKNIISKLSIYSSKRKKTDILFKLKSNIRTLISNSLTKQGFSKKTKTFKMLGCSFEDFKIYVELQFDDWMNWDNYGVYKPNGKQTWNIDHIIPLSSAQTEEGVIRLNHYSNLRPLCSKENLDKRDKY